MNPSSACAAGKKATLRVAFFFWVFLTFAFPSSGCLAGEIRAWVEAVVDGDTLVLASGERLRLRGIDAPELAHGDMPEQYYGREALEALQAIVAGREIILDEEETGRDRYGRLVGTPRLSDGRSPCQLMIELGAAFVYPHPSDTDRALDGRLLDAQRTAMASGMGCWPRVLRAAAVGEFVGTRSSRRFHVPSCQLGSTVRKDNRVHFSSLREAFEAGYAPARECTPWPLAGGR